jgi:NAD(P)-dependent dehydrogenase (short-subunit alcohol dehydrogenase family)
VTDRSSVTSTIEPHNGIQMKIVVIGSTGTIGAALVNALEPKHEVVRASRTGPVNADLNDLSSMDALFKSGTVDAVVSCAASVPLTPLFSLSGTAAAELCKAKLLGQLHLVHVALNRLGNSGSITLTGGVFEEPMVGSALGALVNTGSPNLLTRGTGRLSLRGSGQGQVQFRSGRARR